MAVFLFAVGLTSGVSDDRTINADDILAKIQSRYRVEYDGVTINGDLDIDRLEHLPTEKEDNRYWVPYEGLSSNKKSVESLIRITNSTIRGRVNFNNTIFHKSVDFNGTKFEEHAGFLGVHFRKARNWSNVIFSQYADFLGSEFEGSVTFGDAKFMDYADFEGAYFEDYADFSSRFMNIADFKNTQFDGVVEFAHAKFDDAADFWNTSFNYYASFQDAVFNNDTDFRESEFNGYADFHDAEFNYDADFSVARFNDTANFEGTNFGSINEFSDASFNGTADFSGGNFSGIKVFSDSKSNNTSDFVEVVSEPASVILPEYLYGSFNYTTDKWTTFELISYLDNNKAEHKAWFDDAKFNGYASFRGTNFSYIASFYNATFDNIADFAGVNFNSMVYFDSAKFNYFAGFLGVDFFDDSSLVDVEFNGTAKFVGADFNATDFSRSKFNEGANFEDARFSGKAVFDRASFAGNAIFENADFHEKLSFTGTKYEKLYIRWINLTQGIVYDDLAYMSLMKNFKDLGYFEDYDSCYYDYRIAHRSVPWPSVPDWEETIRKAIDRPLEWFYGYGTKPFNAFFISLFIILAFAVFWWAIGISGPNDRTRASLKDGDDWLDGDITDILGYSFTVFLSGTKFFVDPPVQPKIEGISKPMIKWAFIIERTLGALFSVMFFMAISSTIVRS